MEKIKPITNWATSDRGKDILVVIIVILVGLASFGLGRLSKGGENETIKVEYLGPLTGQNGPAGAVLGLTEAKEAKAAKPTSGAYFASNRGSKYYSLGCTGGRTIKQENKIYFNSEAEAIAAGYEKSASCK